MAPVVTEFLEWLRKHRGLSERTIGFRGQVINRLLPALGPDPQPIDAGRARQVVLDEARRSSSAYVRAMTTTLRGYLRFLAARGACSPWLDQAVPTVPHWRLSALPRYLPMADVERLIASCDRAEVRAASGIRLFSFSWHVLVCGPVTFWPCVSATSTGKTAQSGFPARADGSACRYRKMPATLCFIT